MKTSFSAINILLFCITFLSCGKGDEIVTVTRQRDDLYKLYLETKKANENGIKVCKNGRAANESIELKVSYRFAAGGLLSEESKTFSNMHTGCFNSSFIDNSPVSREPSEISFTVVHSGARYPVPINNNGIYIPLISPDRVDSMHVKVCYVPNTIQCTFPFTPTPDEKNKTKSEGGFKINSADIEKDLEAARIKAPRAVYTVEMN